MKITTILLLSACLSVSAGSRAQKVTLLQKNVKLEKVFREIRKQTGYVFFYDTRILQRSKPVDIHVENVSVEEALNESLQGQPYDFSIERKTITIFQKADYSFYKNPVNVDYPAMDILTPVNIISGTVKDAQGNPLAGVSVIVKGTKKGTSSGTDGSFSIDANVGDVLEFTIVGYQKKSVTVVQSNNISVVMEIEITTANEVVVVGYGTQKKVNLTGSISTVSPDKLTSIPTQTIAQALMGKASGVFIKNVNGQPGDLNGVSYNIRGFGDPLIIIDGVPATKMEFNLLDPSDIEEFNILKDAAAGSVFGARAGNGVILVKTKRGKLSKPIVTYTGNYSLQYFSVKPELVSSAQYFEMQNLANFNAGLPPIASDDQIEKYKASNDPINYPNTNWWNATLRKFAPQSQHNINVRGGSDKAKYFVSGGYFHQDGMLRSDDIKSNRYNLRSNVDISVTKKLKIGADISLSMQDYIGPRNQLERTSTILGIMTMLRRARSYYPLHPGPDPTKLVTMTNGMLPTVLSEIDNMGYTKWNNLDLDSKLTLSYDLPFGFNAKAVLDFGRTYYKRKEKTAKVQVYTFNAADSTYSPKGFTNDPSKLYQQESTINNLNQQYFLTWDKKLNDHSLSALFVYEQLTNNSEYIEASRIRYLFDIDYLFAGPTLDSYNNGSATEDGRKSFISRITYNYKGKYLLELNGRYDGSPRFPKETRWGVFPSASIGWRISEEKFIKDKVSFISNLKIRASYGKLGNDATGTFQYLSTYSVAGNYIYDGNTNTVNNGIQSNVLANPYITWEKMNISNIGIDFAFLNHKVDGSFDYFYRLRSDVLGSRNASIPNIVGASMPQVNYGKFDNRGWELSLEHKNSVGDFDYSIGGNISWNREKCVFIDQNQFATAEAKRRGNRIGQWTDVFWGIQTDGLFQSKEEIENWADIDGKNNATLLPGDVKKIDYNGDGRITDDDKVIIGRGTFPRVTYGISASISWKNFDLNMLWQGAGLYNFDLSTSPDYSRQFYGGNTPLTEWYNNSYTPENPWIPENTKNARWPIWKAGPENGNQSYQSSEFWLINGAYIRLKNIDLGYSLPASHIQKWGLSNCRFFISGYNVLTFSALDFLDPEADTNPGRVFGDYYPPVGSYSIGVRLQF